MLQQQPSGVKRGFSRRSPRLSEKFYRELSEAASDESGHSTVFPVYQWHSWISFPLVERAPIATETRIKLAVSGLKSLKLTK